MKPLPSDHEPFLCLPGVHLEAVDIRLPSMCPLCFVFAVRIFKVFFLCKTILVIFLLSQPGAKHLGVIFG